MTPILVNIFNMNLKFKTMIYVFTIAIKNLLLILYNAIIFGFVVEMRKIKTKLHLFIM